MDQWYTVQWFRGERRAQTRQRMRGIWDCQGVDEYKTEVKYSYYAILILDTVQLIVNSSQRMESYRKS